MTLHDLYLLSPEVSLVGLAALVVLLDMVVPRKGVLAGVALAGLVVPLAFSLALWGTVSSEGAQQGIFGTLAVDKFALFFKFLFLAAAALVVMATTDLFDRLGHSLGEYYSLVLVSAVGMMLLAAATELISLYVALELTALPLAALAAFHRDARSTEAGLKFLLLSAISSAVLLYGMAFVFGLTGTTYLSDIAARIGSSVLRPDVPFGAFALLLGVVLMVAGFGFKIATVPFQMWVPDVYEGAPTPITAYLSVASKAAGFAVILRVFYIAFGAEALQVDWGVLFAGLAVASMTVGNLVAVAQNNIKRMLAYSTIAHAGYMLVGLAAVSAGAPGGSTLGPSGLLFYLAGYTLTNLAAFFAVIAITNKTGSEVIDSFAGMGRRSPWLALVLALSLVSLIGIPPTVGFMAKLYIFNAAVRSGLAWLVVVGVVNSVLSAYYYLRVLRVMYLAPPASSEAVPASVPLRTALVVTGAGVLFFGVLPIFLIRLAERAAQAILS
ncbi:MAG: NADH-quinone oxidoreductase subunit N [Chloroflexi bacterium]|nr:NADH-quinone oxidoreductase subunit N [Chloroflexota bacterium]